MPPLSLAILASVLHMHGADATVASDNKGVEDLLSAIRGQLQEQPDPNSPRVIQANYTKGEYTKAGYSKGSYGKQYYTRTYLMYDPARSNPTVSGKPVGGTRR